MSYPNPYNPPPPPAKQGPSCWLFGGLGCLAILIIGGALIGLMVNKAIHSPGFEGFIATAKATAENTIEVQSKMAVIREAVVEYKSKKGHYPDSLQKLVPDYLPDDSSLHAKVDVNPNPDHISFNYTKPALDAANSTEFLDITYTMNLSFPGQTAQTMPEIKQTKKKTATATCHVLRWEA